MGEDIIPLVDIVFTVTAPMLTKAGSTEHWGPCDEDALDQQDIRCV